MSLLDAKKKAAAELLTLGLKRASFRRQLRNSRLYLYNAGTVLPDQRDIGDEVQEEIPLEVRSDQCSDSIMQRGGRPALQLWSVWSHREGQCSPIHHQAADGDPSESDAMLKYLLFSSLTSQILTCFLVKSYEEVLEISTTGLTVWFHGSGRKMKVILFF